MGIRERYIALIAGLVPLQNAFDGHKQYVDPNKVKDAVQMDDKTVKLFFTDGSEVEVIGTRDEVVGQLGLVDRLPRETNPPAALEASAKQQKNDVGYVEDGGTAQRCKDCAHFVPSAQPGAPQVAACQLVDGAISPEGHCTLWEQAQQNLVIDLAKDPKGQKIAQLIKEGYPQDQAIAIAYSEEKRGDLKGNAKRRDVVLRGATGAARMETLGGRDFLAVPVVALVEGVIWPINAPKPEMVPAATFSVAPASWNGRPVFCGHPVNADGQQVSGNTPDKLPTSFGLVQNARVDGKRLLMEAWLDVKRCEELGGDALATLKRCRAGDDIEISVGAFTLTGSGAGSFGGRSFAETWLELYPDHLALLPPGDEGACSIAMGCGVRAAVAHRIAPNSVQWESMNAPHAENAPGLLARISALFGKLAAKDIEYPAWAVEIDAAEAELATLAGARHSKRDMSLVQAVHDQSVELGATCAPKAMGAKPEGDRNMTKCERTAAVTKLMKPEVLAKYEAAAKAKKSDIMDAILAQIKEKLGLSDAAAADLENLEESTLAELAGLSAPPDANADNPPADAPPAGAAKQDPPAAAAPSYSQAKPMTTEEWMKAAPAEIRTMVANAQKREEDRKVVLTTAIRKVTEEYSEAELKAMGINELERFAKVVKANAPAEIDYSGQATVRAAEGHDDKAAPAPPDMAAMVRERNKK